MQGRSDDKDKIEIKGKVNTAICYARVVEDEVIGQIDVIKPIYNFKASE